MNSPARPLRVFLDPVGLHSRAMIRIANALRRHAPHNLVRVTPRIDDADLVIMYVIGNDAIPYAAELSADGQRYVAVQCCVQTAGGLRNDWLRFWKHSALVWSYYDLTRDAADAGFRFYHSPLGLDDCFVPSIELGLTPAKKRQVVTSGYVSGPGAEAIEEVWIAADTCDLSIVHIGPADVAGVSNMYRWAGLVNFTQPTDAKLAAIYRQSSWVASLRHIEGFELPAAEALACGTQPIIFDQPALRRWYGDLATYVQDCSGRPLINELLGLFIREKENNYAGVSVVSDHSRRVAITRFDWNAIATGFWHKLFTPHRDLRREIPVDNDIDSDSELLETAP